MKKLKSSKSWQLLWGLSKNKYPRHGSSELKHAFSQLEESIVVSNVRVGAFDGQSRWGCSKSLSIRGMKAISDWILNKEIWTAVVEPLHPTPICASKTMRESRKMHSDDD
jgi:hypothetical protein